MLVLVVYWLCVPALYWLASLNQYNVAGLTNNSHRGNAVVIRKCINLYPKLGYQFLDVAKEKDPQKLVLAEYKSCRANLRSSHAVCRASTLQLISPVRYSQESYGGCIFLTLWVQERELIPSTMVDEIVSLNNLDMDLYKHAQILFAKQQRRFTTSTYPQFQEDRTVVLSLFPALCVVMSILLLGLAFILRIRHRVGNDWLPFWLQHLTLMPVHEKL